MFKFRKKPVVIEAMQWVGKNGPQVQKFLGGTESPAGWVKGGQVEIGTLEGLMIARIGDWIIKGVKGEFYPCKPGIFAATYEAADTPEFIVGALTDAMIHGGGAVHLAPNVLYPGPVNGDRLEFELEHANTKPEDRPDWPLPSFDAQDWAAAYCKIATNLGYKDADGNPIDEGWMITWFANALMRGHDEGVKSASEE